ncbi:hypothetical protein MC885_008175, partial [Smutsia gigantea]
SIDVAEALALQGVADVLTAEVVPRDNNYQGEVFYAQNEVICVGQIVCTVAADSYAHVGEAAKKVKIAYEDIEPRIITIEIAFMNNGVIKAAADVEYYANGGCTPDESEMVKEINMYKRTSKTAYKQMFNPEPL